MRRKVVQSSDQSGDVLPSMPPEQFRVELHRQGDQPIGIRAAWTPEQEGLVIYDVREDAWLEDGCSFFFVCFLCFWAQNEMESESESEFFPKSLSQSLHRCVIFQV